VQELKLQLISNFTLNVGESILRVWQNLITVISA